MSHLMFSVRALISEYLAAIIFSALVFPCFASFGINLRDTAHLSTSHPELIIIIFIIEAFNFFLNSVQISMGCVDSLWWQTSRRFRAKLTS
jgi:hypothetical protein